MVAITKAEKLEYEYQRDRSSKKKFKNEEKLDKRLYDSFQKINSKACYDHFSDVTNKTFHNLLSFLTLLERKCEKFHGNKKKYSKMEVEEVMINLFPSPTDAQRKTVEKINKFIKKNKDEIDELEELKFNAIIRGKKFTTYNDENDWDF